MSRYLLRRYPVELVESIKKEQTKKLRSVKFTKKQTEALLEIFKDNRISSLLKI